MPNYIPQPDSGDNCCDCPSRTSPCDDCGGPPFNTGACCVGDTCSILTSAECLSAHGAYQGDGSSCSGVDCTAIPQFGCCSCPDLGESCADDYTCTILSTECNDPCMFFAGFGGYGPASCCDVGPHGATVAVCFDWPPENAQQCCPYVEELGSNYCCPVAELGYSCCGGDCAQGGIDQCCDDGFGPTDYICLIDYSCCQGACCPPDQTCDGFGNCE